MDWSNTLKDIKEIETKTLMDIVLLPNLENTDAGLGSSGKANTVPPLKPRKKSMTSLYLKFFETAPDGKSRRCKLCKQSYSIATATGNLGRHLSHRHPGYEKLGDSDPCQQGQQVQQIAQAVTITKKPLCQVKPAVDLDHLNWVLLKWLIGASLPSSTLEDEMLLNSFKFLNSSTKFWPKEKIHAAINEVFRSMREDVKTSVENISSKVSVTLDFWTSYEQVFYMSVKCHWIDDSWSLHKVVLDVCRIPYPCSGSEILHALMKILVTFNIDKKILSCTSDSCHQAIHACHALKEELDARNVPFCYMPCAARTLNQIIEDGLRTPKQILSKIRDFVLELNMYPEVAEEFKELTTLYQEGSWKFPFDTSTCWSGDYTMMDIVRKAPNSMDSIIKKHEETFQGRNLLLSATEKSIINILHSYLEPFYKITTNLCTCKVPTVGLVLFFMDHVFELISSCRDGRSQEWLKSVADDMAKRARSFNNQVYHCFTFMAAVLDPRIKKELIPENLSSEKNLEEARNHFDLHYSASQFPGIVNGFPSQEVEEDNVVSFAEEIARKRRRASMHSASDELSQYLAEPPVPIATDVLEWWKMNIIRYPRLSVMARDYLAIQGTSIDPDKLFTSKSDELRKQQFCLPYSSMQTVMCINSWIESGYKFKFRSSEINFEKMLNFGVTLVDGVPKC